TGGVGVGGGGRAFARVDDGDDVGLPGRHVRLGEDEAGEQERDRDRQVGCEGEATSSRFDGRCVKTIVRSSPIFPASRTAAWKESACRMPIAKKTSASVCGETPYFRVNR